ncbi:MAG TPA: diguanylate cyclase [Azonexus sp.]|nr:diguanylate cyclase [Azonexus sp.]
MQLEELRSISSEACALRDRYADIYDFAPVSYFTLSAQGTILDLNLSAAILLGIKRSEQSKHRFAAFVAPSCLSEFNAFLADVLTARNKKICEIALVPSRQRPEATVRIEAVADENGRECRMVVIDVSAERQAEKLLAEREHYLRTLLDNFPFMAWLKDDQGRFLAANRAFSAAGLEEGEEGDGHAMLADGSGKPVESMIETDGLRRWFEIYQAPVQSGELLGTVGFSRDITERKETELALQDSDALKCSILNSVPTAIAVIDGDGVILVVNDHWREFSRENGIEPGCAAPHTDVGTNYLAVCQAGIDAMSRGALAAYDGIQAVLNGKLPSFRMEYQCPSPKQNRWFSMTVTPLLQSSQDGAVITHTDLTERKLMERQIREQAFRDPLTKLPNRILFKDRLRHAMASSKRSGRYCALLFLNLDNFRLLNTIHGHEVGDLLLIEVATRLQADVREVDSVARLGGDEFLVIINDLDTDLTKATVNCSLIAEMVRNSLAKPYALKVRQERKTKTVEHCCSVSIGVCVFVDHEAKPGDILNWAEKAMKQAKGSGRNAVRFHEADLKLGSGLSTVHA